MTDRLPTPEKHETREIIRRALIVAFGVLLLIPAACGTFFVTEGNPDGVRAGWYMLGGAAAAFFIGRMMINWVFLK